MRNRSLRRIAAAALAASCLAAATTHAPGQFARIPEAPVQRLTRNLNAFLDENPQHAQAHFLLARVHYIAFAQNSPVIRAMSEGTDQQLPELADPKLQWGLENQPDYDEDALIEHALNAITHFELAIALDPDNALYRLGLAGILEQAADHADQIGPLEDLVPEANRDEETKHPAKDAQDSDDPEAQPLYDQYIDRAILENRRAYELGRDAALAEDHLLHPFYPVAYEAGKAYLRLFSAHREEPVDEDLETQINADIAEIDGKPMAITPVIFRIEAQSPAHLDELLDPSLNVLFDLDADGTAERRPWVRPDTAILVWDPEHTGEITSGKQLFGNMTFFMLFDDGYQALDALDNNRDGQLTEGELAGLALWHDRNSNGVSDAGEVTPIEQTPIRAIATQATGHEGIHPRHDAGLTLDDGKTRPTWDWITPPAEPQPPHARAVKTTPDIRR